MYNQLIYELASKEYISSTTLCKSLNISQKELKKQVDLINLIDHHKFHIKSKTSMGYCLVSKYSINEVIEYLDIEIKIPVDEMIKLNYLLTTDYLKIDYIASENYISYSKAYKVYTNLKQEYHFEHDKHYGQRIILSELERKQRVGAIIAKYVKSVDIRKDLNYIFKQLNLEYELYIEKAIQILNDNRINIKSNMYLQCLIIAILDLSQSTQLPVTEVDKIFGCKLTKASNKFWNNFIFKESMAIDIDLTFLLDEIYRNFGVKLKYSNQDFIQLQRHLEELLARVANGIIVTNQDFDKLNNDFALKYPLASEISYYAINHFKEEYDLELPNIERLYLAIHFQKLLNNANEKLKIIIVCEYGYAMSSLIANEIMMYLEDVEILCIKSLNDFQANLKMYINQVDLIVTTLDAMKIEDVSVISIPNYEIDKSITIIKQAKEHILNNRFLKHIISHTLTLKIKGSSRYEILKNLETYCQEHNLCTSEYLKTAIIREAKGNVVQNNIVYLHGDNKYVRTNCMLLVEFEEEITWLGKKANSMFIIFINVQGLNTFNKQVSNLYRVTMKKEYINASLDKKIDVLKAGINE